MLSSLSCESRTAAVMQPYFYPYAGYFRLLMAADVVVILEDVQFPRRGWVHRCQVPGPAGALEWLTLPLARQPRDTLIRDLAFADGARRELDRRLARLKWLERARGPLADRVRAHLHGPLHSVVGFLEGGLRLVANALDLPASIVRSSMLDVDGALRGQDRILALVEAVEARLYVNPPGGRSLYQAEGFRRRGCTLRFLTPYSGAIRCLLPALVQDDPATLRSDILRTTRLVE